MLVALATYFQQFQAHLPDCVTNDTRVCQYVVCVYVCMWCLYVFVCGFCMCVCVGGGGGL